MFKNLYKNLFKPLTTWIFAITCLTQAAMAGQYDDMVDIEVLPGWRAADGTHMAALQLTLKPGWKTYWRSPGDAGIPPILVWSGSRNLESAQVTWPTPKVFDQSGMTSIGYKDRVILPITLTPKNAGKAINMKLRLQIGICRDVCVPAQFTLKQELAADLTNRDPKIAAALAERPYSAAEAGVRAISCSISLTEDGILLRAEIDMPAIGGTEFVVFEAGDAQIWSSEAQVKRQGRRLIAETEMMHVNGSGFALNRSALRITVLGKTRAVDIQGCT